MVQLGTSSSIPYFCNARSIHPIADAPSVENGEEKLLGTSDTPTDQQDEMSPDGSTALPGQHEDEDLQEISLVVPGHLDDRMLADNPDMRPAPDSSDGESSNPYGPTPSEMEVVEEYFKYLEEQTDEDMQTPMVHFPNMPDLRPAG